jgi:putative iron-dependent peroxidase
MPEPQSGILPEAPEAALFLILRVLDRGAASAVAKVVSEFPARTRRMAARDPRAKLASVVSLGPEFWDILSPGKRPRGFRSFRALDVGSLHAPSTAGDLLLHIVSRRPDACFDLALETRQKLGGAVRVIEEVHGFRYLDSRDLTGFIDGTENPSGPKKRAGVALIGDEDRAFAGGSFVMTQRYVHDLVRWAVLPIREQEQVIGRRKRDSKELPPRAKPPTAHISRVVIEEDGHELEIVRHSFPYGSTSEAGLFFIADSRTLDTFEKMLARMMGASGDGIHDHLMDYTRPVSGANFFAPSLRFLRSLASPNR